MFLYSHKLRITHFLFLSVLPDSPKWFLPLVHHNDINPDHILEIYHKYRKFDLVFKLIHINIVYYKTKFILHIIYVASIYILPIKLKTQNKSYIKIV